MVECTNDIISPFKKANDIISEPIQTQPKNKEKKNTYHQGQQATPAANSSGIGYLMTLANTKKEIHLETNNKGNFISNYCHCIHQIFIS